uniref:G8 domain-containing protein n=1 Tax=Heterosigma akashiwo TaxID=2829 RepID=A0A7S3XP84_HETAK
MDVWGILEVGTEKAPFESNFELVLHGGRTSPSLVVDNEHFLSNKVLAVLGQATMFGSPVMPSWTKLASTAFAGNKTIYLTDHTLWKPGDKITITPTDYDTTQLETMTIISVADGGKTLELDTPLEYNHQAEVIEIDGAALEFAAAVGLLTRNVKVRGAFQEGEPGYGGSLYVVDAEVSGVGQWVGNVDLHNVEFQDTGKALSEHASITFEYAYEHEFAHAPSTIAGCALSNSSNYGIRLKGVENVVIQNNTLHHTYRSCIDIDGYSDNAIITGNLIAGALFSEDDPDEYILPRAGIQTESEVGTIQGNVIGGAFDSGIIFYPSECGSSSVSSNEVHSAKVGAFILFAEGCREVRDFTAWKISDVGVLSVDQTASELQLSGMVIADSHIGMSLNFYPGGASGTNDEIEIHLSSSHFIGTSTLSSCDASLDCRASTMDDNLGLECGSLLGGENIRRVGIMTPQFTDRGKTCHFEADCEFPSGRPINMISRECSMPWEHRYGMGMGVRKGIFNMSDVTFFGFKGKNGSDCDMNSVAIINNPSQIDYTPAFHANGITWIETPEDGKFLLNLKNEFTDFYEVMQLTYSDGIDMIVFYDEDGTLLGNGAGSTLTTNLLLAAGDPYCSNQADWGAYKCNPNTINLRPGVFESLDTDRASRRIGPVKITPLNGVNENKTYWSAGPIDEMCSIDMHFSQFNLYWQANTTSTLYCTGTNPSNMRIKFYSDDPSESVLLKIWTNKADGIAVYVGNTLVDETDDHPTLASEAGANAFDQDEKFIYVTLRGGYHTYTVRRIPTIQLDFRLDIDSVDLFDEDSLISNLASLLNIDSSRIKVVDVYIGSVVVETEITDDSDSMYSNNDTVVAQSYAELTELAEQIVEYVSVGNFSVGYDILDMSIEVSSMGEANSTANSTSSSSDLNEVLASIFDETTKAPTNLPTSIPTSQPTDLPTTSPTEDETTRPLSTISGTTTIAPTFGTTIETLLNVEAAMSDNSSTKLGLGMWTKVVICVLGALFVLFATAFAVHFVRKKKRKSKQQQQDDDNWRLHQWYKRHSTHEGDEDNWRFTNKEEAPELQPAPPPKPQLPSRRSPHPALKRPSNVPGDFSGESRNPAPHDLPPAIRGVHDYSDSSPVYTRLSYASSNETGNRTLSRASIASTTAPLIEEDHRDDPDSNIFDNHHWQQSATNSEVNSSRSSSHASMPSSFTEDQC